MLQKLDNLSVREKLGLVLALTSLLMLVANALVVQPISGQLKRMHREVGRLEEAKRWSKRLLSRRTSVERDYQHVLNEVGVAGKEALESGRLTVQIDDMAVRAGVKLEARSPLSKKDEAFYEEFGVDIKKFDASRESLVELLHAIAQSTGAVRVSRISIQPGKFKGSYVGSMVVTKVALKAGLPNNLWVK